MDNFSLRTGLVLLTVSGSIVSANAAPKSSAKPKIPTSVILENKRSSELTNFSVYEAGQEDQAISSIKKPLMTGKKIQLSLKGLKSCTVTLSGSFADGSDANGDIDICAEKLIRLVD